MATEAKITGAITRWWWVRHAPVPNPERRCYGQSDKDCDVSNEALFRHQAKMLPKGAIWYSSNLLRARKTAEHLGKAGAQFGEVLIDPDLAEQHFGEWQGLTYAEIAENHGNHLFWLNAPEQRPPGGESFVDLRDRTVRSIERLTEKYRGRDIVATAHGGTIRAALAHAFNMHPEAAVRFEIENVSITLIEHFEQADPAHAWRVAFTNYMPREVVALVHGDALGFGCATAVGCDITLVSSTARFAFPEIEHDIPPTMAMCAALGKVQAKALTYLIYSADSVSAQEAVTLASEQYISALYAFNVAKAVLAHSMGTAEQAVLQFLRPQGR